MIEPMLVYQERWVDMLKLNMKVVCPFFNTNRMVQEYTDMLYATLIRKKRACKVDDYKKIRELVQWKDYMYKSWSQVKIKDVTSNLQETKNVVKVGSTIKVTVDTYLGDIKPSDVDLQVYCGPLDVDRQIVDGEVISLDFVEQVDGGICRFMGTMPAITSGQHGYSARIIPRNEQMITPFEMGLIEWQ